MKQELDNNWEKLNKIVLYGLGSVANRFIDKIIHDFDVAYIIDNAKYGSKYKNIPVIDYISAKQQIKDNNYKIIVMTSQRVYVGICRELEQDGFVEQVDFCRIEQFAVEWYWKYKKQINIIQVNTAVTTFCTLNCKNCNMFVPHYNRDQRHHYTFEEMKKDIDCLTQFVDYIFLYSFLGGEPFLNKELKYIIEYVGTIYKDRIGKLALTTNGTLIPDIETLKILKQYHVHVSISDYSEQVPYENKLTKLIETLEEYGIAYTRNRMTEWKDFGFPDAPFHWGKDGVYAHMEACSPLFHGVNDQKLFYCHVVWSADKAGIYTVPKQDYMDLTELNPAKEEDRLTVSRYCAGECPRGFLGFCMVCGGCGEDNDKIVKAGIQKGR